MISKGALFVSVLVLLVAYSFRRKEEILEKTHVVQTEDGPVQGVVRKSRVGRDFFGFYGIPYAKPPVGDLRFEFPQPADPWKEIYDAKDYGAQCAQNNFKTGGKVIGDEDCLSINVFIPKIVQHKERKEKSKDDHDGKLLSVMVYIHGGGFIMDGSPLYGPDYFMDEDILLVTFNYRLSSLGFLNSGDGFIRGNMGLRDQILALKWVQKNIKAFGGDPGHITIFGESAGADAAHLLVLSPLTKGLFHKAILQSGVSISAWSILENPTEQFQIAAKILGCSRQTTKEIVACMKEKDFGELVTLFSDINEPIKDSVYWFLPTVDTIADEHTLLPARPLEMLKSASFHKVPIIIGCNSEEGLAQAPMVLNNRTLMRLPWEELAPKLLMYPKNDTISAEIFKYYFRNQNRHINYMDSKVKLMENYTNLLTDRIFLLPLHQAAIFHNELSKDSPVYLYIYSYHGEFSLARFIEFMFGITPYPTVNYILNSLWDWFRVNILGGQIKEHGVCHADDLALLFPGFQSAPDFPRVGIESKDYAFSRDFVKLWANFARGEPLELQNSPWEPVSKNLTDPFSMNYFRIDENSPGMFQGTFLKHLEFLNRFFEGPYLYQ